MKPRILFYDIETSPLETYTWGLYEQNIAPNQLVKDWHLLSFAAKWLGSNSVIYHDQSKAKDITDDKKLAQHLWTLLDESDIVITQNGKAFDQKKVYARFIYHGMLPPSPSKHIDTKQIAKRNFGFTSNGLAYLSQKLGGAKKSEHKKFPGMELWKECLRGNKAAWAEMRKYNIQDVIALEEVYEKLRAWDAGIDCSSDHGNCRVCDGIRFKRQGFRRTVSGKYQQYQCLDCGAWMQGGQNLLSKDEKALIKRKV